MPISAKEMVKFLKENGFEEVRQNSTSHKVMVNKKTGKRTVVPMHGKDLPIGTEKIILKQAGLKK
jgi:predicted RNA binding protein YcfA (HicA-like mRNA interferase family)